MEWWKEPREWLYAIINDVQRQVVIAWPDTVDFILIQVTSEFSHKPPGQVFPGQMLGVPCRIEIVKSKEDIKGKDYQVSMTKRVNLKPREIKR